MARRDETPRDLLFGLLALQIGLIDQDQLVAAFGAWSRAKGRALAEILLEAARLTPRAATSWWRWPRSNSSSMTAISTKSLASLAAGPSTRERLNSLGDTDLTASIALVGSKSTLPEATITMSVGTATSDGQRFRVLRPHAKADWARCSWRSTVNSTARWPSSRSSTTTPTTHQPPRFLIEAEITGGLEHPGIVPVYGLGNYGDGRPYYAMRFIRGDSLKDAIEHSTVTRV